MGEKRARDGDEALTSSGLSQTLSHEKVKSNVRVNMRPRVGLEGLFGFLL